MVPQGVRYPRNSQTTELVCQNTQILMQSLLIRTFWILNSMRIRSSTRPTKAGTLKTERTTKKPTKWNAMVNPGAAATKPATTSCPVNKSSPDTQMVLLQPATMKTSSQPPATSLLPEHPPDSATLRISTKSSNRMPHKDLKMILSLPTSRLLSNLRELHLYLASWQMTTTQDTTSFRRGSFTPERAIRRDNTKSSTTRTRSIGTCEEDEFYTFFI